MAWQWPRLSCSTPHPTGRRAELYPEKHFGDLIDLVDDLVATGALSTDQLDKFSAVNHEIIRARTRQVMIAVDSIRKKGSKLSDRSTNRTSLESAVTSASRSTLFTRISRISERRFPSDRASDPALSPGSLQPCSPSDLTKLSERTEMSGAALSGAEQTEPLSEHGAQVGVTSPRSSQPTPA